MNNFKNTTNNKWASYCTTSSCQTYRTQLQNSFQAGVNTLYDKCVSCGVTPSAKTPTAIATAIESIYNDRYNSGVEYGKTQAVPKTVKVKLKVRAYQQGGSASYGGNLQKVRDAYVYQTLTINPSTKKITFTNGSAKSPKWLSDGINNEFYAESTIMHEGYSFIDTRFELSRGLL